MPGETLEHLPTQLITSHQLQKMSSIGFEGTCLPEVCVLPGRLDQFVVSSCSRVVSCAQ